MLNLFTWSTQNARKISIMLNECHLDFKITPINIEQDEQHSNSFKSLNPNAKIPLLVDPELLNEQGQPEPIFETGAILVYLAEKTGLFLSATPALRYSAIKWVFWQTSNLGPALGNFSHFASAAVRDPGQINSYLAKSRASELHQYSIVRFTKESFRLLGVLEGVLSERDYIAYDAISIADFACYSWIESAWAGLSQLNPNIDQDFKHLFAWMQRLASREGVQVGMAQLAWGVDLSNAKSEVCAI